MSDRFNQVGKYLKKSADTVDLALKRAYVPTISVEKVRDIFDVDTSFKSQLNVPYNTSSVFLNLTFGPRLPSTDCCADCFCGATESYTSDNLIGGNIYVTVPYLSNSTVVYLDGIRVTQGVEYTESSPSLGQLEIHIPFSTITISYNYTVGNCTEDSSGICVDTQPCPPEFAIFSGLATVFADRFDVPQLDNTGNTYGGCGIWASAINATTGIPTPANIFRGSGVASWATVRYATLGGNVRVAGKSIEITMATVGSGASISLISAEHSPSMTVSFPTSTTLRLSLFGLGRVHTRWLPNFSDWIYENNETGINKTIDYTVPATYGTTPSYIRAAQYPSGDLYIGIWKPGESEASGYSLSLTIGDFTPIITAPDVLLDYELVAHAIYAVGIDDVYLYSLKIGAGLDSGDWGFPTKNTTTGARLNICRYLPDSLYAPHPYFAGCDSEEIITPSVANDNIASYQSLIAFPVVVGDVPPAGSGRVANIEQQIGTVDCLPGKPTHVQIRGRLQVFFAAAEGVSVVFSSYPGTGIPAYNNEYFSGNRIGSYFVATNSDPIPFNILVPVDEGVARWGVHIEGLDSLAPGLDFIFPGLLSPPNYWMTAVVSDVVIEALQSVECTANPGCGDCIDVRCPEVQDGFYSENYEMFHSPNFVTFNRLTSNGITMQVEQDDGTAFTGSGGIGTVTFPGDITDDFSQFILKYVESPFQCRTSVDDNIEASFEFKINTLSPTSGYSEVAYGGWNDGTFGRIIFDGGVVDSSTLNSGFSPVSIPAPVTANTWITVEFRTNGLNVEARIYPTGTTPTSWTSIPANAISSEPEILSNLVDQFYVAAGYDWDANPSNTIVDFKNIVIRRM